MEFADRRAYDVAGAAQYMGLSARTVRNLIYAGELRVSRIGRAIRICREDMDELLDRGKQERVPTKAS